VAERVCQVAGDQQVELEIFCFGPAQSALSDRSDDPARTEFNQQIDELAAAGAPVRACLNAARAAGTEQVLTERGIVLQYVWPAAPV